MKTNTGFCRYNSQKEVRKINADAQLELWIDRYQNLIYSICFQFTNDYFDAQDLAQETFLSAYKSMACFDGKNERAWLCRIAANKCLDYLKAAVRRQIPTEEQYFISRSSERSLPERKLMEQALRQELYDCCMKLKSPYRETAVDYFYYEMDIGEISRKTGRNAKTVQTQVYRAKAMLKKLYRKEDLWNV